ncbi:MAG TPA: glycoside hydrolase family 3 C-terminal domain-containing protein [Tepidisphaeraceae bacterium]|nr:glycoside hydrolase family 3 C-terminal domain-containing protein [Tepidisphaeraceae bacterium]
MGLRKGIGVLLVAVAVIGVMQVRGNVTRPADAKPEIWKDPSQPIEARVRDLMSRMTLEEKVAQMSCNCEALPRLGLKSYSHRNECLHGYAYHTATVFPQAIGMAATWDTSLIHEEANVIATEARAHHNEYIAEHDGNSWEHTGLTFYSPNINIVRDPRWGRGQETYGEDPFLTSEIGVAYITGLQGDNPRYMKVMACAKHFAVHNGPEPLRHEMNMDPSQRDLRETYLPAFEAAVRQAHVGSVMGAYSALYGIPDCASPFLLTDVLRKEWGFDGFVVSDGGAIPDIWMQHKYVPTADDAAVAAVKAGCDVASGPTQPTRAQLKRAKNWTPDAVGWLRGGAAFSDLAKCVRERKIPESDIDRAAHDELVSRFRVGIFDPPALDPYSKITMADNDTPANRALAEKVAEESIVLLKNNGLLPLDRAKIKRIAVIGPNADSAIMLRGNYTTTPSKSYTILDGIKEIAGPNIQVTYARGCYLALRDDHSNEVPPEMTQEAIDAAKAADAVIFVGGIDRSIEGEQFNVRRSIYEGCDRGDRTRIELPPMQEDLIKSLCATGKPVVYVNCSGSAIAMPWENEHVPAIVQAWYPGEQGGIAVAKVLFGDVNPAGRLPETFYESTKDLPDFKDYSMANRTYRYYTGKPLFAFGYGLSYTEFDYGHLRTKVDSDHVAVSFKLKNTGKRDGDEVVQVYFKHIHSAVPQPLLALCGFQRLHLKRGESTQVSLNIPIERLRYWSVDEKKYVVEPGKYEFMVGAASDDIRLHSDVSIEHPAAVYPY